MRSAGTELWAENGVVELYQSDREGSSWNNSRVSSSREDGEDDGEGQGQTEEVMERSCHGPLTAELLTYRYRR